MSSAVFKRPLKAQSDPVLPDVHAELAQELGLKRLSDLKYPLLGTVKIDGMRIVFPDGADAPKTGSMKNVQNMATRTFFAREEFRGFDAEIVVGPPVGDDVLNRTTSGVMTITGDPQAVLYAFDLCNVRGVGYGRRAAMLEKQIAAMPAPYKSRVVFVKPTLVRSPAEANSYYDWARAQGYEGIMLRDPHAEYKEGRATFLEGIIHKVKPPHEGEAEILEVVEQMTNTNAAEVNELGLTKRSSSKAGKVPAGTLGKFVVRDIRTGVKFNIGNFRGFDAARKQLIWNERDKYVGMIVRYISLGCGVKDKPRLPRATGLRAKDDMTWW